MEIKCFRKLRKKTHIRFNNGKRITKEGNPDMLLITSWYISLEKRQLRNSRSMYKKNMLLLFLIENKVE